MQKMWWEDHLRCRRGTHRDPPASASTEITICHGDASAMAPDPGSSLIAELHLHFISAESESQSPKGEDGGKEGGQGLVRGATPTAMKEEDVRRMRTERISSRGPPVDTTMYYSQATQLGYGGHTLVPRLFLIDFCSVPY